MNEPEPLDKMIEGVTLTLSLPLDPAWKPAIRANLAVILKQAAFVGEVELPDEAAPAPVFRA